MADNKENLEDIVKNAEKDEKKKEVSALVNIAKESSQLFSTAANFGLGIAIPGLQARLFPQAARDTAILTGATVAGDATTAKRRGEKYTSNDFPKSSAVGTAIALPVYYIYNFMNKIPLESIVGYLGRAGFFGGIVYPAYIGMYQFVDYIIKNMSFKGLGKYLKENYWSSLKTAWKKLFPFGLANVLFAPASWQIPISAVLSYIVTLFAAPKKGEVPEERKRDKTSYLLATSNLGKKFVENTFTSLYKGAYEFGEAIRSLFPAKPKATPEKPSEQPT